MLRAMEVRLAERCKVRISSGEVDTQKNLHITQEEIDNGYVLSCDTRIKSSDITRANKY